ncbi:hypothetical protein [Campylobacter avium]|nr:hypothetical protein [Campylobacter avium]
MAELVCLARFADKSSGTWACGGVRILYMKFDFDKFVTSMQVFEIEKI